uniref:Uncharacterized protein n=1 Tax=Hyaloperonospora arabidopsidis (strain Emoy2) TaxID=559515 RepID=M4B2J4_HYAAE
MHPSPHNTRDICCCTIALYHVSTGILACIRCGDRVVMIRACRTLSPKSNHSGMKETYCNGVPPLHDNLLKVNIKYEYCVRTNTIFSQNYPYR